MESFAWKPRRMTSEKLAERAGLGLALLLVIVAGLTVEWWGGRSFGTPDASRPARGPAAVDADANSGGSLLPADDRRQTR